MERTEGSDFKLKITWGGIEDETKLTYKYSKTIAPIRIPDSEVDCSSATAGVGISFIRIKLVPEKIKSSLKKTGFNLSDGSTY